MMITITVVLIYRLGAHYRGQKTQVKNVTSVTSPFVQVTVLNKNMFCVIMCIYVSW